LSKARSIQKQLMYDISQIMESRQLSPDYLQNLLNIKKTALYSRINGEKLLNIEELYLLEAAFNLDLNLYFKPTNSSIGLHLPSLEHKVSSEKEYIERIDIFTI
jgi:hypothetical protein